MVLHWERTTISNVISYRVYRALIPDGPFEAQASSRPTSPSFCDLKVSNGRTYYYRVTAWEGGVESAPSSVVAVTPRAFANNEEFLDYVQQTGFDYFWYAANPANGLVPDRSAPGAVCSVAAVGFGLSAITVGIDHGWITREQGRNRVLVTLNTFLTKPQGPEATGTIGYKGWFYHFLNMQTALQDPGFRSELSSIDTGLLLAGVLHAKQFFDGEHPDDLTIRQRADAIVNRVDWPWMAREGEVLSMGWYPNSGFLSANWVGYNEASILYLLGLGAATNPLPASAWTRWTSGYTWSTNYGLAFVPFPPLFGHQYSQCWLDLRHIADAFMNEKGSTYFENSRRATIAQRAYCIQNPLARNGYGPNVWGLTPSDGPGGYAARGAPPAQNDDGTIAPTGPGGSVAFAPEYAVTALRYFYDHFRAYIWTSYGFCDAFNLGLNWWATDVLGIDQGPMVLMIENYRTQKVWRSFMRDPQVQRGLAQAGFVRLPFVEPRLEVLSNQAVQLQWNTLPGRAYQVEFSADLSSWFYSPTGSVTASGTSTNWFDPVSPQGVGRRFYRIFRFGLP